MLQKEEKYKSWETWNITSHGNQKYLFMTNYKNITIEMAFQFS